MTNKEKLLKIAQSLGPLSSIVKSILEIKPTKLTTVGSMGPGTAVQFAEDPIDANGNVHIFINVRGLVAHESSTGELGIDNGVVITAEGVPGNEQEQKENMGSKFLMKKFGDPNIPREWGTKVISMLRKKYPDRKINDRPIFHLSSFSGGGSVLTSWITNSKVLGGDIDSTFFNDGLHNKSTDVLKKAHEAMNDPKKQFVIVHTAIPTPYTSTTQSAEWIAEQLGIKDLERPYSGPLMAGVKPVSIINKGGLHIIRLYDKPTTYFTDNRAGSLGDQHIKAAKVYRDIFLDYIIPAMKSIPTEKGSIA